MRSRTLDSFLDTTVIGSYVNGALDVAGTNTYPVRLRGTQRTNSFGHEFHLLGKTHRNIGGGFDTQRVEWEASPTYVDHRFPPMGSNQREFFVQGPIFPYSISNHLTSASFVGFKSASAMNGYGATGIARADPTNPLSGLGQFLGELRDLPKVPLVQSWEGQARGHRDRFRRGGSEYLNIEFGWLPFLRDIRDFAKVTKHLSRHARNYARNSGRHVRRRSHVYTDTVTQNSLYTNLWYGVPPIPTACVTQPGKVYKTEKTTIEVDFSGAFTYYLPSGDGFIDKMRYYEAQANHLYGTRLTPELLYNLAPWSWALDWVTNAGDVIHNFQSFALDGLVMHYGYVMAHQRTTVTYSGTGLQLLGGQSISAMQTINAETKQRIAATPFGFGLNPNSFTARQWAIIAALGISHKPRQLG